MGTKPTNSNIKCAICGGPTETPGSICPICAEYFSPTDPPAAAPEPLDLSRYRIHPFPWEPNQPVPRLLAERWTWVAVTLALIGIIVLLSLLRTPLPSCWELSG